MSATANARASSPLPPGPLKPIPIPSVGAAASAIQRRREIALARANAAAAESDRDADAALWIESHEAHPSMPPRRSASVSAHRRGPLKRPRTAAASGAPLAKRSRSRVSADDGNRYRLVLMEAGSIPRAAAAAVAVVPAPPVVADPIEPFSDDDDDDRLARPPLVRAVRHARAAAAAAPSPSPPPVAADAAGTRDQPIVVMEAKRGDRMAQCQGCHKFHHIARGARLPLARCPPCAAILLAGMRCDADIEAIGDDAIHTMVSPPLPRDPSPAAAPPRPPIASPVPVRHTAPIGMPSPPVRLAPVPAPPAPYAPPPGYQNPYGPPFYGYQPIYQRMHAAAAIAPAVPAAVAAPPPPPAVVPAAVVGGYVPTPHSIPFVHKDAVGDVAGGGRTKPGSFSVVFDSHCSIGYLDYDEKVHGPMIALVATPDEGDNGSEWQLGMCTRVVPKGRATIRRCHYPTVGSVPVAYGVQRSVPSQHIQLLMPIGAVPTTEAAWRALFTYIKLDYMDVCGIADTLRPNYDEVGSPTVAGTATVPRGWLADFSASHLLIPLHIAPAGLLAAAPIVIA